MSSRQGQKTGKSKGRGRGRGRGSDQQEQTSPRHTASNREAEENVAAVVQAISTVSLGSTSTSSVKPASRSKSDSKVVFARRPEYGTTGRNVSVTANHFPVQIGLQALYHYDVEVEFDQSQREPSRFPVKPVPVALKKEVMEELFKRENKFKRVCPAYDGNKNVFTCAPIEDVGGFMNVNVTLRQNNRDSFYKVKLQPVEKEGQSLPFINLAAGQTDEIRQQAIMSLDFVLRYGSQQRLVSNGRAFFCKPSPNGRRCQLSDGKLLWSGFYQSLRPDESQTVLIVNKSSAIFYPECSVLRYIEMISGKSVQGMKKLCPETIRTLNRELKEVRFIATHLEHRPSFKCDGVTTETSREISFTREVDGRNIVMTVDEYFHETYKKLSYPMFPCLKVSGKFFPLEVGMITGGQIFKKNMTDKHRSEMIKITITPPERTLENIRYFVEQIRRNSEVQLRAYKIVLDPQPMTFPARVIDPPSVVYQGGRVRRIPRDGSWQLRDTIFYEPGRVSNWVIWCTDRQAFQSEDLKQFSARFCNTATRMGLCLKDPLNIVQCEVKNVLSDLAFFMKKTVECTKGCRLDLLLIVLPEKDDHLYAEIKYVSEVKLGLMTQCMLSKNVRSGGDPMLICNILQKVNSKMGGRNCSLFSPNEPATMFIGADVNHAGARDREKKSFAAVVASVDSQGNRYASHVREQTNPAETKHHLEMIGDVKNTVKMFLTQFYRNTGKHPQRIIYYRDGVSEGEFADLQRKEIGDIRAACHELKVAAKLTVLVVVKRHHTRLFPTDPRDGVGKHRNVAPGTVVDKYIVHPLYYDFYLCSHFGIQGTSRPTHYTVLVDDSNFSPDNLQKITYYLCHMSARCTRAESIPTPVKYAHLSALRARQYALHVRHSGPDDSDDEDQNQESAHQMLEQVVPIETMQKQMYFV